MTSRCRSTRRARAQRDRGFTLIELMLVLTLIVVIAAMAAPAFQGPVDNFRLIKSADLVRARWAKARCEAMRSGRTMMFRYQPQTGLFEIAPWQSDQDYLESSQVFGPLATGTVPTGSVPAANLGATGGTIAGTDGYHITEELAENVTFAAMANVASTRDMQVQQLAQSQAGALFSPPILFYPDGTSTTTRVTLGNKRQRYVMIQLRGLSGVAEVSEVLTVVELPP